MSSREQGKEAKRPISIWIIVIVVVLLFLAGGAMRFPPALMVLWLVGEVVIPAWETLDPTVPRLPTLTDDVAKLDADARGKALRATVDKFYPSIPESRKSWLRKVLAPPYVGAAAVDVSKIVQHYIPAGTSFDEAEHILKAAGMTVLSLHPFPPERLPDPTGEAFLNYGVRAELDRYTSEPPGYMRLRVHLSPQDQAASTIGRTTASLSKQIGAPTPPVSFPFDASKASTTVDATIRIVEEKYYLLDLVFRGASSADMRALRELAGDAERRSGIVVPVHVVVTNEWQQVLFDRTIDTRGMYASSTLRVLRRIGVVGLRPGLYRIRASTTEDIPELSGANIELSVTYDARF